MKALKDSTLPPRTGIARMIPSWEYRHLKFAYRLRFAGGAFLAASSALILAYRAYAWAALFGALAASQHIYAYLERRLARART